MRRGQEGAAAQTGRSQGEARRLGRGGQPGRRPGPLPGWGGIAQALALSGLFWPLLCLVVPVAVEVAAGGQAWLKGIRSDSRLELGGVGCPAGVVLCGGCWSVALVMQDQPGWRWWPRQRAGVREGGRYWRGARECPYGWGASARLPRLRLSGLGSWPPTSQGTPSARLPSTVLALAALPTLPQHCGCPSRQRPPGTPRPTVTSPMASSGTASPHSSHLHCFVANLGGASDTGSCVGSCQPAGPLHRAALGCSGHRKWGTGRSDCGLTSPHCFLWPCGLGPWRWDSGSEVTLGELGLGRPCPPTLVPTHIWLAAHSALSRARSLHSSTEWALPHGADPPASRAPHPSVCPPLQSRLPAASRVGQGPAAPGTTPHFCHTLLSTHGLHCPPTLQRARHPDLRDPAPHPARPVTQPQVGGLRPLGPVQLLLWAPVWAALPWGNLAFPLTPRGSRGCRHCTDPGPSAGTQSLPPMGRTHCHPECAWGSRGRTEQSHGWGTERP